MPRKALWWMKNLFTAHLRVSNTITDVNTSLTTRIVALSPILRIGLSLGLSFGYSGGVYAADPSAHASRDAAVLLRVKPVLCIIDERQPDCEMTFLVEWNSGLRNNYCLEDDVSPAPLNCWVQESSGEYDEARVVKQSFKYQLMRTGQTEPLAEAKVELMTIDNSDRRRNRRSRHAWSIL
jgi:hypothetical protein